ncbi:MAG: putative sulfate exporter family transporter [Thermoleophilia bacterium]|nr:putative sulfate exporter family transporter [Thermoleophilia bacterium]
MTHAITHRPTHGWLASGRWTGLAVALAAAAVAVAINRAVPALSPLLTCILMGVAARHAVARPAAWTVMQPGLAFAARRLLRAGIVLLGLQLSLADIAAVGWTTAAGVCAVVAGGIAAAMWVGRRLGLERDQAALIACGFSICGAAAVAGLQSVLRRPRRDEAATAIALVVLFGTLMIGVAPLAVAALGLGDRTAGVWIGGSVHEVAQVVAASGLVGTAVLKIAVLVKLMRVLCLAPVLAGASWLERRRGAGESGALPPPVPLFVVAFVGAVALRSTGVLPAGSVHDAATVQGLLLGAAMFALGTSVHWTGIRAAGLRPIAVAGATTLVVAGLAAIVAAAA